MKWFGKNWGAPICQDEDRVPTPSGRCGRCDHLIQPDDQGFVLPYYAEAPSELPYHRACLMEAIGIEAYPKVDVFTCGGDMCGDGEPHVWDGPSVRTETSESATCSKCGMDMISWSLWNLP